MIDQIYPFSTRDKQDSQYKEIFSLLTNDIQNLKSNDFDLENYRGNNLTELTVKLSIFSLFTQ